MASDTPRVDAAAEKGSDLGAANTWMSGIWPLARQLERELSAAQSQIAALKAALEAAKIPHHTCEDCWYSCPKSPEGCCNEYSGDECTCGADEHNAAIDAAMKAKT